MNTIDNSEIFRVFVNLFANIQNPAHFFWLDFGGEKIKRFSLGKNRVDSKTCGLLRAETCPIVKQVVLLRIDFHPTAKQSVCSRTNSVSE
jgi:hypothetical protein